MSTTRNVSMIGSITSSGIRVSLLFWMFNVSSEFKFSNAEAGKTDMLRYQWKMHELQVITSDTFQIKYDHSSLGFGHSHGRLTATFVRKTYPFFCRFRNVMESP